MPLINAAFLALIAGTVLALPGIIAELGAPPKDVPLLVDVKQVGGRKLSARETFWVGLLIHFLMTAAFGLVYYLLVSRGVFRPYRLGGLIVYATGFYLAVGLIVFPLLRLGLFGRKQGQWVWFELLVVHHLLGLLMWLTIIVFPVLKP